MPGVQQIVNRLKLYELLEQETDEGHPILRIELCKRLNYMCMAKEKCENPIEKKNVRGCYSRSFRLPA